MKKMGIICVILAFVMTAWLPVHAERTNVDTAVSSGSHSLHASTPLAGSEQLVETAKAALLYELNSDTLLYTWNADERINPTGLVKLLTSLIVLEKGNLDDLVTVYRSTLDTISWGAVSAGLKAGEKVPLRDLLMCVMVASANDAAAVMAAHIAGSQKAFVELMNEKAKELGCTNSNFTNVHGLMDAEQYSTARDLAIITEAALENEQFTQLFSLDNFSMAATNLSPARYFITTNYMMSDEYMNQYFDYRVTGGKPAAASSRDRSMICTAEFGKSRYLIVVMSAEAQISEDGLSVLSYGNFLETRKLMNFAFNGYTVRQVLNEDQTLYQYPVKNGQNDVILRPARDVLALLPADFDKDAIMYNSVVDAASISAPVSADDKLGVLQITYQGLVLANCDLVAVNDVLPGGTGISDANRIPPAEEAQNDQLDRIWIWAGIGVAALGVVALVVVLIVTVVRSVKIRRTQMVRARKHKRGR